jgi:hypothetical protein
MKMKQPLLEAYLTIKVFDKNGKEKFHFYDKSRSWTKNYYSFIFSHANFGGSMRVVDGTNFVDTLGVNKESYPFTWSTSGVPFWGPNTVGYGNGVIIGIGETAEDPDSYALGSQVANGTGAGQMEWGTQTQTYALITLTYKVTHSRTFTNNSGGLITVKETGLEAGWYSLGGVKKFLINRDRVIPGVAVEDGETLYVGYTIQLTFPE